MHGTIFIIIVVVVVIYFVHAGWFTIVWTRNVDMPKGRPTWCPPSPSRWWFRRV